MILTHANAESRYTEIRQAVLKNITSAIPDNGGLQFALIDDAALATVAQWPATERRVGWNWVSGYQHFKFQHPKRFELALWHNDKLVNLSLGRPTSNAAGLRLDFTEACPGPREVKVVPLVLMALIAYARAIGASEIRLVDPINQELIKYYEKFGLSHVRKGNYLFRKLG